MATFPTLSRKPSAAAGEMVAKGAIEAKFGSGYTQRAYDGINSVKENFSVAFTDITQTEFETVRSFLITKIGVTPFDFVHPTLGVTYSVVCKKFTNTPKGKFYDINLDFEQD
jgi:phage-related protein